MSLDLYLQFVSSICFMFIEAHVSVMVRFPSFMSNVTGYDTWLKKVYNLVSVLKM